MKDQSTKLSIEGAFRNIIECYWKNLLSLVSLFVILAGPYLLASTFLSQYFSIVRVNYKAAHSGTNWIYMGYSFLGMYLSMLVYGLGCFLFISAIILRQPLGDEMPQDSLFRYFLPAYRRIASLFMLAVIVDFIVTVGMLLFIVPGCILWTRYCVSVPAMISGETGFLRAMQRSVTITKGHKARIILIAGIVFILSGIVAIIPSMLVRQAFPTNLYIFHTVSFIVGVFIGPFMPLTVVYLYHELKRIEQNTKPTTDADLIRQAEFSNTGFIK